MKEMEIEEDHQAEGGDKEVDDGDEGNDSGEEHAREHEDDHSSHLPVEMMTSDGKYRNKQRLLLLSSRGVTARYRHLLEDLRTLLPHQKKEAKLDPGKEGFGSAIHNIAEMRGCNSVLYLECRKRMDCYMWLGKVGGGGNGKPPGPSVKFLVTNVHTMDELRLTGNCMKGSRPILMFDDSFHKFGHLKLIKELFIDIFGTPRGHPKSKPFVDRIMSFYFADNRIWVRNYQILEQQPATSLEAQQAKKAIGVPDASSLVEIGPRFVLSPIRIFRGSFGGQTLFQNPHYITPSKVRSMEKKDKGSTYTDRVASKLYRQERTSQIVVPEDPLANVFKE